MKGSGLRLSRLVTRGIRRYLVGPEQRWAFERPSPDWTPPHIERTSLYLHVPFCRHSCPYCPYTKVQYRESLVEPFTLAAIAEVGRCSWAGRNNECLHRRRDPDAGAGQRRTCTDACA